MNQRCCWILAGISLIILLLVLWLIHDVEGLKPPSPPSPTKLVANQKPPSPGPIIIVNPGTPGVRASWFINAVGTAATFGASNTIRCDVFGAVMYLKAVPTIGKSVDLDDVEFDIDPDGTGNLPPNHIKIEKLVTSTTGPKGMFNWSINGHTLLTCNQNQDPNCGDLPAEFNGFVTGSTLIPDGNQTPPTGGFTVQARADTPCQ